MRYLHTMLRISDPKASLAFFCDALGLTLTRQKENPQGRYTLYFLAPKTQPECEIELTFNWDAEQYSSGRNFGHIAYEVEHIYQLCTHLIQQGIELARPPRDGRMAFIRSPDGISIELLQQGDPLPLEEPWVSMPNQGTW